MNTGINLLNLHGYFIQSGSCQMNPEMETINLGGKFIDCGPLTWVHSSRHHWLATTTTPVVVENAKPTALVQRNILILSKNLSDT